MTSKTVRSVCRICFGLCGVVVEVDDDDRIAGIRGDRDHVLSQGYTCLKGRQAAEQANSSSRLLHPLKRQPDGTFIQIPLTQALDEIAERMRHVRDRHGPSAIAGYRGTAMAIATTNGPFISDWLTSLGSGSFYTTNTIDQVAKFIMPDILGRWEAGRPHMYDADAMLLAGVNPIVSATAVGFVTFHPVHRIREARQRGMKLIVVDPRRTETAQYADVHLQPYPGEDPTVAAGLIREILLNGWEDATFCADHVEQSQFASLKDAVQPFTPQMVERRAGVPADDLRAAAQIWGSADRPIALTGTGSSMAYRSNLSELLYQVLEVLRGSVLREGESITNPGVITPSIPMRAQVIPPTRPWDDLPPGRIRGASSVIGEKPSGTLADEILTPGEGQVRAFFCFGGNPAATFPDRKKINKALKSLDLLVVVDPFLTDTARLADYVLPPAIPYERPDMLAPDWLERILIPGPFQQYVPAVTTPAPGSDVLEDWRIMWELARRLGVQVTFQGVALDMETPPTSDALIEVVTRHGQVPLEVIKNSPGGAFFPIEQIVAPPDPEAAGRFHVMPDDFATELQNVAAEPAEPQNHWRDGQPYKFTLASRRLREVYNTYGFQISELHRRRPYNPAYLHPDDLAELGLSPGDYVTVESQHGNIIAIVDSDPAVKRGVVSMSHGWGHNSDTPNDVRQYGSSTGLLIADDRLYDSIHCHPRMSGIPVNVVAMS